MTRWRPVRFPVLLTLLTVVLSLGEFRITPALAAPDFVVLGDEGIRIEKGSTVAGGDIGANRGASAGPWLSHGVEVSLDKNVRLLDPTSRLLGNRVHLDKDIQVFDVHTNALSGPGTVSGQVITPLALPLVTLPAIPPVTPGSQDLTVPQQGSLSLAAGNYGILTVGKEATVTLAGGLYHFAAWALDKQVRVQMAAPVEVRIAGRLAIDKEAVLGPAPGTSLTAADLLLIVTGINGTTGALDATPKAADIGKQSTVRAKLYVPHGTLRLDKESTVTGALVAKWVEIGKQGHLTFEGGFGLGQPPPSPPTITSFTPTSGNVGDVVTIAGANFVNVSAVTFNGVAASSLTVQNPTTLTAVVPPTATTGPLAVTTPGGTATSTGHFIVIPTQDMQVSVLPAALSIPSTGQASFAVTLTGSSGFTNVAALAVTGLPSGMTAIFKAPTLTARQSTLLTLTTNGTIPAGNVPLTVTATGLVNGTQTTRSTMVTVQVLAAGVTTLTGLVLDEDDKPVKGALAKLGALQVATDDGGNFLLQNPPVGMDQLLFIDGGPASTPTKSFPIIPFKVTIVAGQPNTLGFVPHLHFQKTTGMVNIANSGVERIVTDPEIPGFQMTILAGATITGWDGQVNTQVSVRRVPTDHTPLPPMPPGRISPIVYMDYFGKPGGGTPTEPIPITFPNDVEAPPGTQVELWYFDEAPDGSRPNQWAQYGTGTVSADGSQIVPDLNPATGKPYGQPRFCCGARRVVDPRTQVTPNTGGHGSGISGGDPVDLATGIFTLTKTDLVLPGRTSVTFTRRYRTQGLSVGPFGPGTSHNFDIVLLVQSDLRTVLLPGPVRVLFARQPNGTFINTNAPAYRGAVVTQNGSQHILRLKDGATWTFGAPNIDGVATLSSQADRNGNRITLTRSEGGAGEITTITDATGRQLQLSYTNNRITAITDPLGRTITYLYDGNGRVASVTDPEGGVTRYTYDTQGRMLTLTDARGITFLTNQYDGNGRVIKQTQADSGLWQFAYTVSAGVITQTVVTDPAGKTTTHRFNGQGYPLAQQDGQGQATTSTRNGANQVTTSTDAQGRKTTFTYDAAGNVTSITDPDGKVTQFEYEPVFNRVTKLTDALNQVTTFTYDANGNLLTTTDPTGAVTTIAYNSFGQPTSVTDALGNTTSFAYDTDGNLITTTDALGTRTQRAYDAVSRLVSLTNPRGFTAQFGYDPLNRATQITDALNGLTAFTYDPNGNLLEVKDAKAQATTYTYDSMDRLQTRTDALTRLEQYVYDLAGNLAQFTDRKHQQATFTYDALNRRTRADYADGSFTTFTYDAIGRLTRATDSTSGSIDFFYDNLDRLILDVTPQGAVAYEYDAIGRRTKMTVAGQAPVTYQYDAASRLTQVAQGLLVVGLGYDAAGRRTSLTYPNGTSTTYTYDNASRLTRILHQGPSGVIEDLVYTYDTVGNRTSLTRSNGTASLLPNAVSSAMYDAANEQTAFAGATLTYDQNGNLTSDGTNTYTWDTRNRLVGISGGVTASFSYDALGRRVSKTIGGTATQFLYDGNDIVLEFVSGSVNASFLRSLNIDEAFVRQGATNEFYHADALGSTLALSSSAGTTAVSYSYEAFGKATVTGTSTNPFQFTGRENDSTGLSYYRARYYSPSAQRFISEDPLSLARIVQVMQNNPAQFVDQVYTLTLFEPSLQNEFAYVTNNPITYRDPLGYQRGVLPGLSGGAGDAVGSVAGAVVGASAGAAAGAAIGMQLGFVGGGALGLGAGPLGSLGGAIVGGVVGQSIGGVVGGLVGGYLGGQIGSLIDNRCAGALNCGEDELLSKRMGKRK